MARFTTRVELHNANEDDYTKLHLAMESAGFLRTIQDGEGKKYQLPTAEYNFDGDRNINNVLDAAEKAAKTTKCTFEILVTESNGRRWLNLIPAK